uniref:B30.2/SPRY domain-containing protein n=1 Tax=Calidris pygmaea TaxID=425635 RepID=A0A8C3JFY9_9CHAR
MVHRWLEGLRFFLEDHARRLLAQLRDLEREVEKTQEDNLTSLTQEISRLDAFIQEMEEKCQQPASKFLEVRREGKGDGGFEKENFQQPQLLLPELDEKIARFREKNTALEETLRTFQGEAAPLEETPRTFQGLGPKVTLDPSTAHPQLVVSEDGRSVRWEEEDTQQDPSDEGPGTDPCVLGHQGITSGRCCWEVEVTPRGSWALGVARESLKRREETSTGPEVELWSMGLCEGQFWALTSLERVPLYHIQVPKRLRVALDYEKGQVAFFDAEKRALIFTFPAASFEGERVHPWFLVWGEGSQMTLCP